MEDLKDLENNLTDEKSKFYENAQDYWSSVEPTVDGMLGGFGCLSSIDIKGSELFLMKIFSVSCLDALQNLFIYLFC